MTHREILMIATVIIIAIFAVAATVIIYRKKDKTEGEGCMSIVVLSMLWAAFCFSVEMIIELLTK